MPSGKIHDLITFALLPPAFLGAHAATHSVPLAVCVTIAFAFGGLMFGPDLDIKSAQYERWNLLRFLWIPYKSFFKHRSRWSHGLIFGSLLRVVYFFGVLTATSFLIVGIWTLIGGGEMPTLATVASPWHRYGELFRKYIGQDYLIAGFIGIWFGGASHTVTDIVGSFVKTGRIMKFL